MTSPIRWKALSGLLVTGIGLVLTVGLVQIVHGQSSPPLFDGVGFPDEPYRYVTPPLGAAKTVAPEGATKTVKLLGDKTNDAVELSTVEKGPQITAAFRVGVLQAESSASTLTVALIPVRPDLAPVNGTLLSNVYSVRASTDDDTPVTLNGVGRYYISLRVPQATREAVGLEVLADGAWQTLRTTQTGSDVYSADVPVIGDVAAVLITNGDTSLAAAAGSGGSGGVIIALVIAVCAVAGVGVFTVRTRALRNAALAQPPSDQVSGDMSGGRGGD